jgi:Asp-tRNA(Asn)/Glu-tRNA(Gln) amidotransferase A subunit family amidase
MDRRKQFGPILTEHSCRAVPLIRNTELPAVVALASETCLANVVGGPAFTMPGGDGEERFVGLQISSVFGKDAEVFAIGKRIVSALRRNNSEISLMSR